MSTRTPARATEVVIACPAHRDGMQRTQQQVYGYALAYLCDSCAELWAEADQRAHRSGTCPHRPRACTLDRAQCVQQESAC